MSTVRTLALGTLLVFGVAGVSAAQSPVTPKTRADSGQHRRGARPDGQMRRGQGGGREGMRFRRDLNLTDAQKAQMKAIHQKYQPQNQALRDRAKPFMEAARTARQKGDTVAFRSNMEKGRQVMQSGQSIQTQERSEVRAILTPDQQAKFDARQKATSEHRAMGGKKGWGRMGPGAPPAVKK
jgi:Spy/CpxP family protein refolding chaperone